jgi:hypothetical protein
MSAIRGKTTVIFDIIQWAIDICAYVWYYRGTELLQLKANTRRMLEMLRLLFTSAVSPLFFSIWLGMRDSNPRSKETILPLKTSGFFI